MTTPHSTNADVLEGPLHAELDVIIHSLSIAASQLSEDEAALVDGLLDRAHTLAELPEERLAELVEQAQALIA